MALFSSPAASATARCYNERGLNETLFDRHANRTSHGNLATEEKRLERVFGVEEAATIVVRAARGETANRSHDKR